jgi:hypothetical protein
MERELNCRSQPVMDQGLFGSQSIYFFRASIRPAVRQRCDAQLNMYSSVNGKMELSDEGYLNGR